MTTDTRNATGFVSAHAQAAADGRSGSPVGRGLSTLLMLAVLALGGLMLAPPLLGYQRYVVDGGSMGDELERGSIVYERSVPTRTLRVGDVITYTPPRASPRHTRLTHRIVWSGRDRSGARVFQTKGDANRAPDPWRFGLSAPTQARAAFHIPYVGYALAALSLRWVRIVLIGLPALAIALSALATLWRDLGEQGRAQSAAPQPVEPVASQEMHA